MAVRGCRHCNFVVKFVILIASTKIELVDMFSSERIEYKEKGETLF